MRKIWIVVANSSQATFYRAENVNSLLPVKTLKHSESLLSNQELVSDKPGKATFQFGGPHPMEMPTSPRVKERIHFAEEIARVLEEASLKGEFSRLYLIANPTFLGHLRQILPANLSKLIHLEISKDLTSNTPEEIREYLPPVL